jgi:hypothetical protein
LNNPPELVKDTLRALLNQLGHDEADSNDWSFIKKQLQNSSTLMAKILDFNADTFDPKVY